MRRQSRENMKTDGWTFIPMYLLRQWYFNIGNSSIYIRKLPFSKPFKLYKGTRAFNFNCKAGMKIYQSCKLHCLDSINFYSVK